MSSRILTTSPDEVTVQNGAKYCLVIDFEDRSRTGKIWNEHGEVEWSYGPLRNPLQYSSRNPFNKPDFVVFDANGNPTVTIRRVSFVPSRFHILDRENVIGQIAMRSVLLNKYKIEIAGIATCAFRMPLFTRYFHGHFNDGTGIWAVVGPGTMQWRVLLRSELNDVRLLSSLAFIHNQWFRFG